MRIFFLTCVLLVLTLANFAQAQTDGFESIFNGKDLTGWSYLPTTEAQKKGRAGWQKNSPDAPPWPIVETKVNFDGKAQSSDGRFMVQDEVLVVAVPAEGRKVQMLYSDVEIKGDFVLKLEFRASNNADSGVFIRGHQLQCRDYPNAGPYKDLKKFKSEDWNELEVVVKGETAVCTCNGEVLEESFNVPVEGPIGVEGDRGKLEYRNIRIKQTSANLLKATNKVGSWTFETTGDAKGAISSTADSIVFETIQTGSEHWHVQAYQAGLDLQEGTDYTLSFEIKANNDGSVSYVLGMINEADWHPIGLYEEVLLNEDFEKHAFKFTATDVVKGNCRVGFVLGDQTGKVTVRNLVLQKMD